MDKIDLRENEFLEKFVSQDPIDSNDVQFWYQLLSRSFNFMRVSDPKMVDKTLDPYLVRLALNNSQSLNIGSLIRVFLDRVTRIRTTPNNDGQSTNPYYVFQSFNALYLLRTITKSYIENVSEEQLMKAFRARNEPGTKADITPGSVMLDHYISTLIAIIVDIPAEDSTYLLLVESINALLVLLSIQMYSDVPANKLKIYECFMEKKCSIHALVLTKTLLNNFVNQKHAPAESGSIIIGLASGLWKVLTLGYGPAVEQEEGAMLPLARQSLLLLNILTNHCTTSNKNPYREAIMHCQDTSFSLTDPSKSFSDANNEAMVAATTSKSVLTSNSIKIDFRQLYETICRHLDDEQVALLLYMLLHSNPIFKPYISTTAAQELDKLLLPLLKILYLKLEKGSHHIYMVLIIFIIMSEQDSFNDAIQRITVRNILWYKERVLSEISLASFTTLIMIRSFQYNTFRVKDRFLHSNLFATLANLSNYFDQLHPYVCQRLIGFLERLGKRYALLTKTESNNGLETIANDPQLNEMANHFSMPAENGPSHEQISISMEDNAHDAETIAEVIRMMLEVINNVLVVKLKQNPNLIYTLLYKRGVFTNLLSSDPSFYNLVINVERILTYSYEQIEAVGRPLSEDEIKTLIGDICQTWESEQNNDPRAKLLFNYVEDVQPEEFFIPYIWTRVYYTSKIPWESKRIVLFNPELSSE